MSAKTIVEVLEELWDAGNCTGLDGWVGPGRGAGEVDGYALDTRRRDIEKAEAALSAAGFGPVKEAKAEAWDEGHEQGFWNGRLSQKIRSHGDPTALTGADHAKAHNPYRATQ